MNVTIRGHFDGKVIVPDEPLDLPPHQRVIVHVQPVDPPGANGGTPAARGADGAGLLRFIGTIPADDLRAISNAVRDDCERIDRDGW